MENRIMVTGGAGFIGSHLCDALVAEGNQVFAIDNLIGGKKENISHLFQNPRFYFENINIYSDKTNNIFKMFRPNIVFHLAAIPSVQYSLFNPAETHEANVQSTVKLLELSNKHKVNRLIFASSSAVYGDAGPEPISEFRKLDPLSPYGLEKKICEEYCQLFSKLYDLETVSLRYFNVFGPRQNKNSGYASIIPILFDSIKSNISPKIFGDGLQTRDFCHVDNIVAANILAMKCSKKLSGEAFNIGVGESITINKLCELMNTLTPEYSEQRSGDIRYSHANIDLAKKELGYTSLVNLESGLSKTLKWYN